MGLFKKKSPQPVVDLKCPAEGCDFVADDKYALARHIGWRHPELSGANREPVTEVR